MSRDDISPKTLAEAEKLAAIELTGAEREQVLAGLPLPLNAYERRRLVELRNADGPALRFDPRLSGACFDDVQRPLVRSADAFDSPPPNDEELGFAPLVRLSRWIERRELTSERLTRVYLERLARIGPSLECVVASTGSLALEQAARADRALAEGRWLGPLHGIPWGAKDLFDTAGIATTWGAAPYRDRVPERDATVVARLAAAGAVLVAKLSLGELAMGNVWFGGETRSPWQLDHKHGSGGSSAGSATATAAGLAGFTLGTETLGSIADPSATCGVVGLRPTFGRVPRTGAMALCWSFDKVGPICRSVEDTALVFDTIRGPDDHDPDTTDLPFNFDAGASVAGRRVGYVSDWFAEDGTSDPERAALDALREIGLELVEVRLAELPYETVLTLVHAEAAAAFDELTRSDRDDELRGQAADSWPNVMRLARFIPAVEYIQLQRVRRRIMQAMHEVFSNVDAIVAPGMGHVLSFATNASGHPSLTLPVGLRDDGTPAAVTLHAPLYAEGPLCELGMALEKTLNLALRPGL